VHVEASVQVLQWLMAVLQLTQVLSFTTRTPEQPVHVVFELHWFQFAVMVEQSKHELLISL
jgi:hypothetical protein